MSITEDLSPARPHQEGRRVRRGLKLIGVLAAAVLLSSLPVMAPTTATTFAEAAQAPSKCPSQGTARVSLGVYTQPGTSNGAGLGNRPYYATQRAGSKNDCVTQLQIMLNNVCKPGTGKLKVDGDFGPHTKRVVERWQSKMREAARDSQSKVRHFVDGARVDVDGIAGKQTWSTLSAYQPASGINLPAYLRPSCA